MTADLSSTPDRRTVAEFDVDVVIVGAGFAGIGMATGPVSYTHLTLPTNREV